VDEWLKVVILGIVEGVTEFLPVSSTGHLILTTEALQLRESLLGTFEIFIQIGAVMAVIGYYRADLWRQTRHIHRDDDAQRLWLSVLVAFIPAAVLGLLFNDVITDVLFSPDVVAFGLIVGGVLFLVVEHYQQTDETGTDPEDEPDEDASTTAEELSLTYKQALVVGLWQVLALIPGMSRSGMSIVGGMITGLSRRTATQFSFYLSIPTLGGATVYTLLRDLDSITLNDLSLLIGGALVSMVVAWVAIDWLLRYISSNNFVPFGYYRIVFGVIILLIPGL
jgi:undecaprenyl-diphosphatase